FKTGEAGLMPGAQRAIGQLVGFLNNHPETKISVEGHTDNTGSESSNMMLSQKRAESVASALMARGISPDRITTKGFGEMYPVANNDSASGRQENRRVEIVFLSNE
ncbi:MAG: OmpA family protein, partial [Desulforhopalus sp.]